jgi:beta-xylosidase
MYVYSLLIDNNLPTSPLASNCTVLACNNGYCNQTAQGPICICDEGFIGTNCNQQGSDFYQRTQLMPGIADPNVLAINNDLFILMGTANGLVLPIFQSTDLIDFQLNNTYNPSASDSQYDYCSLWAPNLVKNGNGFDLHFVAQRVSKGAVCPQAEEDVTTFLTKAPNNSLFFGIPELVDFGNGAPKGRIAAGCNDDGCLKTIRIDPAVAGPDLDRWYFYVWFSGGNNIASFPYRTPTNVTVNAGPAFFPIPPIEENINEAPEVFYRNGYYYLFFSTANFNSQYAMSYIMAPTIADLTRNRVTRIHSIPQRDSAGNLVQTHGSNSIVLRRGQFFNVFHQGIFDGTGHMIGRSTFKQRIAFRPDGSIQTLNTVDIRWNQLP